MLLSQLFPKPIKNGKKYESPNATYLINGGFIDQVMAGVYTFLPLGTRVLSKIETIVRQEMNKISQELFMPSIVPKQLWEDTNRINTIDVLFKVNGANDLSRLRNNAEYILNCTHEDVITPIAKRFALSYKDFPIALYQIQTKFRNEPRAKSGIMRGREFRMKDLYSFHTSEEDLLRYYNDVAKPAYVQTFKALGLGDVTVIALASGGDFTDKFSHEFQTICDSGEDTVFYDTKNDVYYNREVTPAQAPKVTYQDPEMLPLEDVSGEGIIGVKELSEFLKIPVEKTTKTILFETETGQIIAAAVRGGYEIDEGNLKKIIGCKSLKFASVKTVEKVTNAKVGYAGLLNLPKEVTVYMDESMKDRLNFEMGANKTNYHTINVNFGRDLALPERFYDLKVTKDTDLNPETGLPYEVSKAAEVGNIFPLQTKFSEPLNYTFKDEKGEQKIVWMGSYGIGTSRVMGVLVEKFHDERGIIWPIQVAPYHVHLIGLDLSDTVIKEKIMNVYNELQKEGIEVLFDDRDQSAGAKFADADLIGIPVRLVVSKRTGDKIEYKLRKEKDSQMLELEQIIKEVKKLISATVV